MVADWGKEVGMFPVKRFAGTASRTEMRRRRAVFQESAPNLFSRFALICGRDALGPNNHFMLRNADSAFERIEILESYHHDDGHYRSGNA